MTSEHTQSTAAIQQWFLQTQQQHYRVKHCLHNDCTLEYYLWGTTDKPLLIFIHGNGGHANWWDFIAPAFADHYCVIAPHLAGMGNSGNRNEYSFDSHVEDIIAIAKHAGFNNNITVVGHSMGGVITLRLAQNFPDLIKKIVVIDTPLIFRRDDNPNEQHKPERPRLHNYKGKQYSQTFAEQLARYRLIPEQPCLNPSLLEHVAKHSIKQTEQGWCWKFDEGIYFNFKRDGKTFALDKIHCPMDYFYAEHSALVPTSTITELHDLLNGMGTIQCIQDAHHHLMLDQPLSLIAAIETTLQAGV